MPNQPFYPNREGDQLVWFTNLQTKIATYYTQLDVTTARQPKIQLATSTASAAPPTPPTLTPPAGTPFFGMLTFLFNEIALWKRASGYTPPIGQDLAIVGAAPVAHTDPPALTGATMGNNNVQLAFTLYEHDGVSIQSTVQGESGFSNLATDTSSPYNDTRPVKVAGQAEWRDYRACWLDNDVPNLDYGPVIRVLVQG